MLLIAGCIALLVAFPKEGADAALSAVTVWATVVVPTLLPFFICTSILAQTGATRLLAAVAAPVGRIIFGLDGYAAYIFLTSALGGCPAGAKAAAELCRRKEISAEYAGTAAAVTLTAGPMFILGTVGAALLHDAYLGVLLLCAHLASSLAAAFALSFFHRRKHERGSGYCAGIRSAAASFRSHLASPEFDIGHMLQESVTGSVLSLLTVGGIITAFSVVARLLDRIGASDLLSYALRPVLNVFGVGETLAPAVISGVFEMTTGVISAAGIGAGTEQTICTVSLILGFTGLSSVSQVKSVLSSEKIKAPRLIAAKLLHAVLSVVFTRLLLLLPHDADIPAFASGTSAGYLPALCAAVFAVAGVSLSLFIGGRGSPSSRRF